MTKLIAAAIIILVLYGGVQLFFYWEKVRDEEKVVAPRCASNGSFAHALRVPRALGRALRSQGVPAWFSCGTPKA